MNRTRMLLATLAAALLASVPSRAAEPSGNEGRGRVVILGFDGADARTVRELMEKDPARYPTFKKLAETGTFAPLEVVVPAESPVSWASLNSGQNPAKTGVPGFIKRQVTQIAGQNALPTFGFIEKKSVPLEELAHVPWWAKQPAVAAGVAGGGTLLVVLLLGWLVFRRLLVAVLLAVITGGGAAFAGFQLRALLPKKYPRTANVNQVQSFWDYAARAGVPCIVLDAAESFDASTTPGAKVLHGLGLPDSRNGLGDWFIYTTDPAKFDRDGDSANLTAGTIFRVDAEDGAIHSHLYGPRNFYEQERLQAEFDATTDQVRKDSLKDALDKVQGIRKYRNDATAGRVPIDMEIHLEDGQARVKIGSQEQTVKVGEWSEFYELTFPLNWLVRVHALTRVRLLKFQPYFEMLVNVFDIDPRSPPFWQPLSSPPEFSAELASQCGLYETYGWPTLTMPFKDEKIEPEVLLEDVQFTEKWRETLTHERLVKDDWRCLMSVFSTTDRVQHMTYQYYDEKHPLYKPEVAARELSFFNERIKLSEAIPAIYHWMDGVIGDVLARLRPEDTLLVVSDHGFQTFRRQVHLNNWLLENGYLALKPGLRKEDDDYDYLRFVDWSKTRAYACGLGFVYVNLQDREPLGIVPRDDWRALVDEIRAKLLTAKDPGNGERFCQEVYIPRDIHKGDHLALEADLIPGFRASYRVGWSTSSGGLQTVTANGATSPAPICSDNELNWSGDHLSMALSEVKGVFFSNKKVVVPPEGVRALQIAPTALKLLGVPIPEEMDLPPLEMK